MANDPLVLLDAQDGIPVVYEAIVRGYDRAPSEPGARELVGKRALYQNEDVALQRLPTLMTEAQGQIDDPNLIHHWLTDVLTRIVVVH